MTSRYKLPFTLTTDWDRAKALAGLFEDIRESMPPEVTSACFMHGDPRWRTLFVKSRRMMCAYLLRTGQRYEHLNKMAEYSMPGWFRHIAATIRPLTFETDVMTPDRKRFLPCAHIIRPHSIIRLIGGRNQRHLFIPSPIASGHDLLNEQDQLDAEFPGVFLVR